MKRRHFLKTLASSGIMVTALPWVACNPTSTSNKLRILVLGGTYFVGPAVVEAARTQGHSVTLFNRGITNPDLFPDIPLIKGDRQRGLTAYKALKEQEWDVVIDVWPEKSRLVAEAAKSLQQSTRHYVFISSIAVYRDYQEVGLHEGSDVVGLDLPKEEWNYAEEKLSAEKTVANLFPDNHTILRPGPIIGWRDPAQDLLYWLLRLKHNREILAPGSGKDPIQFIDVKDVGRFAIHTIEQKLAGTFNVTGPEPSLITWQTFLERSKSHLGSSSKLFWASEEFLREQQVRSFEDLPLWAPLSEDRGFMQISNRKMTESGFQPTPMASSLDDCLKWHAQATGHQGNPEELAGLTRGLAGKKEKEILDTWKTLNASLKGNSP